MTPAQYASPASKLGSCVTCNAVLRWCRHEGVRFDEGQGISAGQHACFMASLLTLLLHKQSPVSPCSTARWLGWKVSSHLQVWRPA